MSRTAHMKSVNADVRVRASKAHKKIADVLSAEETDSNNAYSFKPSSITDTEP
jgi:hypothetical protein